MNFRFEIIVVILISLVFKCCDHGVSKAELCIQKGDFEAILNESGEIQAVHARSILIPFVGWKYGWRFKLTGMVDHGTHLHKGDSVGQIDPANVMKYLVEQSNLLETENANLNKLLVEHDCRFEELDAQLRGVQADYVLKKLELEKYEFESQRKKNIKQLEFQQSQIHLNRIKKTLELEKAICRNGLKIQKIKVSRIENSLKGAQLAILKLRIISPIDGIFQISKNRRTQQLFRLGDDTYQGAELAQVPDLSEIKVRSTVNETDIGKVKPGQKVVVRLEAFPEKPFDGRVSEIGKLSYSKEEKSKVKVFDLEVILDSSDPVLKPGMTVSCEVYYAELADVYYVDNCCLKKVNDTYYLSVKVNKQWVDQQVEIGPRNNNYTVVYGNFQEGTELLVPEKEMIAQNR